MTFGIALLFIAILAGQAAAAASSPGLFKRQLSPGQIPAQCQSSCSSAETSLNSCGTDLNCLCSDAINKAFSSCLECAISLTPDATTLSTMQDSLNAFEQGCTQAGHAVTPITLTVPNGSSGTPTATSSESASSAPAATSTAAPSSSSSASSHNGARMVGASVASVAGAVGVALAALV